MVDCDCDQFGLGSRAYQICAGESELPLRKVNQFRALYGIMPLADEPVDASAERIARPKANVSRVAPKSAGKRDCFVCGGGAKVATLTDGPGSRLIAIFKSKGFEACDACYELAAKMDQWGDEVCLAKVPEIVADILPRALEWERAKVGWLARLIPEAITAASIRKVVMSAIKSTGRGLRQRRLTINRANTAKPRPRSPRPHMAKFVTRSHNFPPLAGVPIDRDKLVTHVLYHFMPLAGQGEAIWRKHADWLREVRSEFNGRLLVGIATPSGDDRPGHFFSHHEAVKESLSGLDAEFLVVRNDKKMGEGVTFPRMLEAIKTNDPNAVFFYGHTKGVTRADQPEHLPPHLWAEAMFETLFRNRAAAVSQLDRYGITGPFLMRGNQPIGRPGVGPWWFFSGTFFAARCVDAFRGNWSKLPKHYGCVEQWPRLNFNRDSQASCLFLDNCQNLYDAVYWSDVVTPAFEQWRVENARLSLC